MTRKDPNSLNFFEHLDELRVRIFKSAILWLLVFIGCFAFVKPLFKFLARPYVEISDGNVRFAAFDLKEPFMANIKAAFWVSLILSSGIFFYHLWGFVSPGLTKKEKRFAIPFVIFMAVFFMVGCYFSFTQVFPYALDYLIGWNAEGLDAYTRSSYLSLLFAFVLGMGASFELPLVIFFLAKVGVVTPRFLIAKFKYAVILIFTLAAIITPTPDIWMQTFLAVPMLGLYLLGVGAAYLVKRKEAKQAEAEAGEGEEDLDDSVAEA